MNRGGVLALAASGLACCLVAGCTTRGVAGRTTDPGPTSLPPLTLRTTVRGTSVEVDVVPVDGARDYRIYPLPDPGDVDPETGVIAGAIYRCSGDREAPRIVTDGQEQVMSGAVASHLEGGPPELPFARTAESATLGFVFREPGPDRIPVYAVADGAPSADTRVDCFFQRYTASRAKRYLTSISERDALLAAGWRDDGIAFYAPTTGARRTIHRFLDRDLLASDEELSAIVPAPDVTAAFDVLTTQVEGASPLMRVYYANICAREHDELAVGADAASVARHQGAAPIPHVHWSGLTGPTTLVIEALDEGCPFQGHFAAVHRDADATTLYPRQAWLTLEELRAASTTGEVFINGQHDPANRPRAIARSTIVVAPSAEAPTDWSQDFDAPLSIPAPVDSVASRTAHYGFDGFALDFIGIYPSSHAIGHDLGELWVTYGDAESTTTAGLRVLPDVQPTLEDASYTHVRMDVDFVSTDRRYSQIVFSDQPTFEDDFSTGYGIVVRPSGLWASHLEVWICDHATLPDGCTMRPLLLRPDGVSWEPSEMGFAPTVPLGERAGVDRVNRVEVFASTQRVYVQVDGEPHGCVDLPPGLVPAGPSTLAFHDILFVSSQDCEFEVLGESVYAFHREHMHYETRRHFDALSFSSGEGAPPWDHARVPCWPATIP